MRRTEDGPLVFFRPGRAADYIKTAIPTPWPEDPPAEGKLYGPADLFALIDAPRFIRFVQEIFDNNLDLAVYAWRILGYAIEGRPVEDILPLFCGPGRNGKTTLLELLMDVLGPLAGPIKSEMMLKQRQARSSAAPDSDVVGLRGKRLVWASETDEGRRLNAGRVKWLTGGDTLVGRPPHGRHEITFSPSHTLILSTNNLPRADARDRALWARIRVIPFKLAFVGNPQGPHERQADPDLLEKLKAEAPGILAWLVAGWVAYRTRGLDPPEEVTKATDDYREDEDVIGQFISECCILDETARVLAKDLYQEFKQWADDQGIQPVGRVIFGRYLGDTLGLDFITPGNRKKYLGIGLLATELPGAG
ncbi:MAG: hypothetical protein KJ621_10760 [Proteobacteria bacterium]|nr:hypothetical protein [Pseudomonadota bacterium]MBU1740737.1 hypothetical protein [Pseudomonadota bacterium]